MDKYQGIKLIELFELPHPDWEFVRSSIELKKLYKKEAKYGWTVRSCLPGSEEVLYLPHKNWAEKEKVPKLVDKFQKELNGKAILVVYPSWEFVKSGNILISENEITLEGVYGFLGSLLRGERDPDATYTSDRYNISFKLKRGDPNFLNLRDRRRIGRALLNVTTNNVQLEWSLTTDDELFFHDLLAIKG
jgi:hypothetical protein